MPVAYTPSLAPKVDDAIAFLKDAARDHFQQANDLCDSIAKQAVRELGSPDALAALKHASTNDALSRLAQGRDDFEQLVVYPDKIVRRRQPVFNIPDNAHGRAHLYAPAKRIGNTFIPTLVFNCLVIWVFIGVLYFTLYFDLLRRFLAYFENLRKRRLNKRLQKLRI